MLKKTTAMILVIFMVLMSVSTVLQVSAATDGDVNSDGKVNSADYLLVKRHVLGTKTLTSAQKTAADVDGDGDVDRIDYIMIKRMALGTLNSAINTSRKEAISYAKSYTKSLSPYDNAYPDTDNAELTDGYIPAAALYDDPGYSGYQGSNQEVVINLGSDGTNICGFELNYLINTGAGVYAPASLTISGSNSQNGTYTEIAKRTIPSYDKDSVQSITINLTSTVDYKYIKFTIGKNSAWYMLAETLVYGIVEGESGTVSDPYEADTNTDSWRTTQLSSAASGVTYSAAKGRTVISTNASVSMNHSSYDSRVGLSTSRFTDGTPTGKHSEAVTGKSYNSDGTTVWNGINTTNSTVITMTLNNYSAVTDVCGFAIHCFNRPSAKIKLPEYVDISVCKDGYNYYTVGRVYAPDTDQENFAYTLYLDTLLSAKYVRFTFPASEDYMWIEEIEVYGNRSASTSSSATTGYLNSSSSVLGGVEDVALIYFNHGYGNYVNQNMLLPYVGYLDEQGNVVDTMFDGFLFLPQVADMKCEGHTPYGTNCAEDWLWYYDEMFKTNFNLDALNKTAEKVKLLLGKSELKLKVFLTIPHMDSSMSSFGDINGDGVSEVLTSQTGRVNTAVTYAKMLRDTFNSKNYANLELCGFYWFHEEIADYDWSYNYTGDAQTAKAVTSAIKSQLGLPMFWIPYYQARGYTSGSSYGFEAICYQPNYAFDLDVDASRIAAAATTARQYGYCLEMEMADGADVDYRYFQKYMDYLSGGVTYGYMNNAIHMYYQNFDTIGRTWNADSARARLIYTYTYEFMKGTLDVTPDAASKITVKTGKNTAYAGTVNTESTDAKMYQLSMSPDHGSVAFASDGSFVYYPNKGFTGTDTFTYQISNYLGWSTSCTVSVTVG